MSTVAASDSPQASVISSMACLLKLSWSSDLVARARRGDFAVRSRTFPASRPSALRRRRTAARSPPAALRSGRPRAVSRRTRAMSTSIVLAGAQADERGTYARRHPRGQPSRQPPRRSAATRDAPCWSSGNGRSSSPAWLSHAGATRDGATPRPRSGARLGGGAGHRLRRARTARRILRAPRRTRAAGGAASVLPRGARRSRTSTLLHPPGGLVGGDRLRSTSRSAGGAHALLTTPAATKVYRSARPAGAQEQRFARGGAAARWSGCRRRPSSTTARTSELPTRVDLAARRARSSASRCSASACRRAARPSRPGAAASGSSCGAARPARCSSSAATSMAARRARRALGPGRRAGAWACCSRRRRQRGEHASVLAAVRELARRRCRARRPRRRAATAARRGRRRRSCCAAVMSAPAPSARALLSCATPGAAAPAAAGPRRRRPAHLGHLTT